MIGLKKTVVNTQYLYYHLTMRKVVISLVTFLILVSGFLIPSSVYAVKYSLIPPSEETLTRGQEIQFIVTIDTQGKSLTTATVGMTFDTTKIQYISTTPGNAMSVVSVSPQESGKLLFNGTSPSGFTGQGDFAFVTFKIIADAPGSTELCALFSPQTTSTPTPTPTLAPGVPTSTPTPVVIVGVTTAPTPTAIPATGSTETTGRVGLIAIALLALFAGTRLFIRT